MQKAVLRMIAWEVTRSCNLACVHCRASAERGPYPNELSTEECKELLKRVTVFAQPTIILTGGEPLVRGDIFEIAAHGSHLGLRMVMAPNGTLVTPEIARRMVEVGIQRISISLDAASADKHDSFRGVPGAFQGAIAGIRAAKEAGLPFQINSTITRINHDQIKEILRMAVEMGAAALHIFLLVPTGRAEEMKDQELSPQDYEKTLHWFYEQRDRFPLALKATCAPHYYRILRQRARQEGKEVNTEAYGLDAVTRGCLGGISFCFISHVGKVQPCGYLELDCGNVRNEAFQRIWEESPVFRKLRDVDGYEGKCGYCEFRHVCGGCRARAYSITGNYLAEEPYCVYQPTRGPSS
ncbi:MAG: heme b synthase [Deltaproteobacteria bacterium]|nr:heme b synthase [Deltaproteobacteria bacterium]